MTLFITDKKNGFLSDLSHVATVDKLCCGCRKGPEPEEMDKDMILQEKEAEVRLKLLHCAFFQVFMPFCVFVLSYLHDHCNVLDLEAWLVWILIWNASKICRGADHKFPWHVFFFFGSALPSWEGCRRWLPRCRLRCKSREMKGRSLICERKVKAEEALLVTLLRRHHSCQSPFQVICDGLTRETVDGRDDHLVTFYCLPLFCSNLTEDLEPFFFFLF